jgi:hypothetical protein
MAQGPMQFGADNNAGASQTVLRTQGLAPQATLWIRNSATPDEHGPGLRVEGGNIGVRAEADFGEGYAVDAEGAMGVRGTSHSTWAGVFGDSQDRGNGVEGRSLRSNGVQGVSDSYNANGVYGVNTVGGCGVAGRTFGRYNDDKAAVLGESFRDPGTPAGSDNGKAAGVYGYSETGYGGVFITRQTGQFRWKPSGGLRVVGEILKTQGEYSEALPHPDGSQRLLYAPLSPESWYEDYGRAQLVGGRVEVELDTDFVAVLGIEDGEYHVFLTPEGDTQGLYVESRSARSFIVREQQAGTSNTTFSYRVAVKNEHRQPRRLAILDEPEELTKPPQTPSRLTSDQPDPLV